MHVTLLLVTGIYLDRGVNNGCTPLAPPRARLPPQRSFVFPVLCQFFRAVNWFAVSRRLDISWLVFTVGLHASIFGVLIHFVRD